MIFCFAFCNSNVWAHTPSRLSRLQDGLLLSEKVHTRDFAMEEQTRAKQICDDDRKRFRRLHDEEWERERVKRLCSRLPPKITQKNEEDLVRELEEQEEQPAEAARIVEDRMLANQRAYQEQERVRDEQLLERLRAQEEQRAKDAQIMESRKLARRQVWQEQRLKDEQLLETYRLARLRDRELRNLRVQENEQRRRITRARDDSMVAALLRHEASKI